jgi:hypothetical protein
MVNLDNIADMLNAFRLPRCGEAVLLPQMAASRELIGYWESACFNRGLKVRVLSHVRSRSNGCTVSKAGSPDCLNGIKDPASFQLRSPSELLFG